MKLSSILSLAAATIGTSTTLFTSAQHHNLHPPSKFNGINSPTNSIVPNDVDLVAVDAVAVDDADDVSRKLMVHDDKHDMFAMIEAVMEEEFGLTAADGDDGGRRLSKSNKSGKGIDPEDKVLGLSFIVVGFLEIVGIVDEDDGTAFLTQLSLALTTGEDDGSNGVRKLMEGNAILDRDDIKKNIQQIIKDAMTAGGRRLQTGGTIDLLGLAWLFVGILINQGVPFETIVNERLGAFTPRVVDNIGGILGVEAPFTCPTVSGSVARGSGCCVNADCANQSSDECNLAVRFQDCTPCTPSIDGSCTPAPGTNNDCADQVRRCVNTEEKIANMVDCSEDNACTGFFSDCVTSTGKDGRCASLLFEKCSVGTVGNGRGYCVGK